MKNIRLLLIAIGIFFLITTVFYAYSEGKRAYYSTLPEECVFIANFDDMKFYEDKMGGFVVVSLPEKVNDESKFIDAYTSLIQESRKYWGYVEINHMSLKGSQFTKKENIDILLKALKAKLKKNIILTEYDDKEFTFKVE